MCSGGGSPATITMPDTGAYDRMAQMQFSAIQSAQEGAVKLKQAELNQALTAQNDVLAELKQLKVQNANDVAANAARMAALLGAPPPDKTAQAPVIGSDRASMNPAAGKKGLRIDTAKAAANGAGSGLNITTGV